MTITAVTRTAMALVLSLCAGTASAQITARDRYASIVVDARNGNVLSSANADEMRHPASLTKIMTLYMLFEAMRDGRLNLATPIRVSAEAASRPPSKLGVPAGGSISTESAILALVTRSANDIAAAVAEALAGDEDAFARAMTQRARSLGMTRTTFRNASGLPDAEQLTTARDMSLLGRRLLADFPDRYHYFSVTTFAHGNRMIRNHNGMLRDYAGTDGIKTGFINASGFNIVTSAQREGVRLVGAVFGGTSWPQRNDHMAGLLDDGFQRLGVRGVPAMAASAPPRVVAGRDPTIGPGPRRLGRPTQTAGRPATARVQPVSTTRRAAARPPVTARPAGVVQRTRANTRTAPAARTRPTSTAAAPTRNTARRAATSGTATPGAATSGRATRPTAQIRSTEAPARSRPQQVARSGD